MEMRHTHCGNRRPVTGDRFHTKLDFIG